MKIQNNFKKVFTFVVFLGILFSVIAFTDLFETKEASADWYTTGGTWGYRKSITIDNTKVAGSIDLTDFPMLFSVTDADLRYTGNGGSVGKTDGTDILFTLANGSTKLDHEIEKYDQNTGELNAWVEIPALDYNDNTVIYIYYGNSGASDQQNISGTWNGNYKGVWHLDETVTNEATGGTHYDSTSVANNATQYNNVNSTGKIGVGQYLDGTGDYLAINSDVSNWLNMAEGTMSFWYKSDGTPNASGLFDFAGGEDYLALYIYFGPMRLIHRVDYGTEYYLEESIDDVTTDTNWHNIVATWKVGGSPYTLSLVYDGTQVTNTDTIATPVAFSGAAYIGIVGGSSYPFRGTLDEFRIINVARSVDWITTEYNNQSATSTFYSVSGTPEEPPASGGSSSNVKVRSGNNTGNSPSIRVRGGVKFR